MNFRSVTKKKMIELQDSIQKFEEELAQLNASSEKKLWLNDLVEFASAYTKWVETMDSNDEKRNKTKKAVETKKAVKRAVKKE